MDGVLVDFQSGIDKLSDEVKKEYEGRIDDRAKHGASEFPGEWIQFGSERFPSWEEVTRYLISKSC